MSVEIDPVELGFQRPFTVEVAQELIIKNPNTEPIAFKVKTTAPKRYCVRPNAGRIEAGSEFSITVLLQAMKAEPPADSKCRDKFLVQSATITSDKEFASIATVLDTSQQGLVKEKKIRVNWLPPAGHEAQGASALAAEAVTPQKPRSSPGDKSVSETPEPSHGYSSPAADSEPPASEPPPYSTSTKPKEDEEPESLAATTKSTVTAAAATVASTAQATYEELKTKLAQAEEQIAALREQGLRQRNVKTTSSEEKSKPAPAQLAQKAKPIATGVAVPIVALLCFTSFLLAYLFF